MVLAFAATSSVAFAYDTVYENAPTHWDVIGTTSYQDFGTKYVPSTNQVVCGVGVALGNDNSDGLVWTAKLRSGGTNPVNGTLIDTIVLAVGDYPTGSSPAITDSYFNSCHNLTAGQTYFFSYTNKGNNTPWKMGKRLSGTHSQQDSTWTATNTGTWSQFSGDQELALRIIGFNGNLDSGGNPAITGTAQLVYPTDGSSIADFDFWNVELHAVNDGWVRVQYSQDLRPASWSDEAFVSGDNSSTTINIRKTTDVFWSDILRTGGSFTATPQLYDRDENLVYTGASINFSIVSGFVHTTEFSTSTFGYSSSSTAGGLVSGINCADLGADSGFWDGLACQIKKSFYAIGEFMFKPSDTSMSFISEQYSSFKTVFPFNLYFSLVGGVRTSVSSSTFGTTASTLSLGVAFPIVGSTVTPVSATTVSSSIPVFTSTQLADRGFSTTVLNWWFNLVIMLCWVGAAYGIFKVLT